jgi:hypothetical protein
VPGGQTVPRDAIVQREQTDAGIVRLVAEGSVEPREQSLRRARQPVLAAAEQRKEHGQHGWITSQRNASRACRQHFRCLNSVPGTPALQDGEHIGKHDV